MASTPETKPFLVTEDEPCVNDSAQDFDTTKRTWTQLLIFMGGGILGMLGTILISSISTRPEIPIYSNGIM
jgi:hypothetical protein